MRFKTAPVIVAASAAALLVPAGAAHAQSAESNLTAMFNDYRSDRDITDCRFTQNALTGAKKLLSADVSAYNPDFGDEINREIKRWKDGGCAAKVDGKASVKVSGSFVVSTGLSASCPKGGASCKYTIKATTKSGKKTVTIGSKTYTIRPGAKASLKMPLNSKGKSLLRKKGRLKAKITITGKRGNKASNKRTLNVTLKKPS